MSRNTNLTAILIGLSFQCAAQSSETPPVTFSPQTVVGGGAAVIEAGNGGFYVYSDNVDASPPLSNRISVGKLRSPLYTLFTAQEEDALWHLRQKKIREMELLFQENEKPSYAVLHKSSPHNRLVKLNWPKVVVDQNKICVPQLQYAEAADWREHLTCWNQEQRDVE